MSRKRHSKPKHDPILIAAEKIIKQQTPAVVLKWFKLPGKHVDADGIIKHIASRYGWSTHAAALRIFERDFFGSYIGETDKPLPPKAGER